MAAWATCVIGPVLIAGDRVVVLSPDNPEAFVARLASEPLRD